MKWMPKHGEREFIGHHGKLGLKMINTIHMCNI